MLKGSKFFFVIHRLAFIIAFAVGCIYVSHHFFIPQLWGPDHGVYDPLPQSEYGDEVLLYAPRAHAMFKDFRLRGDFSLAEYQESPSFLPLLNPFLLGGLGKIFGSFNAGVIASDFIFPALIFFILYFLMREIGVGTYGSLIFGTIFSFSPQFGVSFPPISRGHIMTLGQSLFPYLAKNNSLYFSHFDEPKFTFLFFVLSVYLLIRALKPKRVFGKPIPAANLQNFPLLRQSFSTYFRSVRLRPPSSERKILEIFAIGFATFQTPSKQRRDIFFAGISFGILFYTYLYDWASMAVSLVFMGIFFMATKDYHRLRIVAAIVGIGMIVSGYYWVNLFMLNNISTSHDVIARLGGEFSYQMRVGTVWKSYIRAMGLIVLLWVFVRHRTKEGVIVVAAILLSYLVVVNEQVITGFNVQPDHWYRVQFLPIAMSVFFLLYVLYEKYGQAYTKKYTSLLCVGFFIYFFGVALAGQYVYSQTKAPLFSTPLLYQESFDWLNRNIAHGSVVGTLSFDGNLDLQLRTPYYIFNPFGLATIASEQELWTRFMFMARLWGVDGKRFASLINQEGGAYYLFGDQYGIHTFDAAFFPYSWRVPNGVLAEKTAIYEKMLTKKDVVPSGYQLDYLFVDRKEFPQWKESPDLILPMTKVFDNGRVVIYAFH